MPRSLIISTISSNLSASIMPSGKFSFNSAYVIKPSDLPFSRRIWNGVFSFSEDSIVSSLSSPRTDSISSTSMSSSTSIDCLRDSSSFKLSFLFFTYVFLIKNWSTIIYLFVLYGYFIFLDSSFNLF